MAEKDEMRNYIKKWIGKAEDIEELARIYATIMTETGKQLSIMSNILKIRIADEKNYHVKLDEGFNMVETL